MGGQLVMIEEVSEVKSPVYDLRTQPKHKPMERITIEYGADFIGVVATFNINAA